MPLQVRIQSIKQDIDILINENLSSRAQSAAFAAFAGQQIESAKQTNKRVLGRVPPFKTTVDGREGAPLESVKPDGIIITEFQLIGETLKWIGEQLEKFSPVKTGRYKKSHAVFADGQQIELGAVIPDAAEFVFINLVPYARKIERGSSTQAPDGVYQAVSILARRRFGNTAKIEFSYRTAIGGAIIGGHEGNRSENRNPAIIVTARGS